MNETQEMLPVAAALRTWLGPGRMGRPIAPSTAWRWFKSGSRAPDGTRVHLRVARVGGRLYLRRTDLLDFVARCSGEAAPTAPPAVPCPAPAAQGQAAAENVLRAAGILPPQADAIQERLDRPKDSPGRRGRRCRR